MDHSAQSGEKSGEAGLHSVFGQRPWVRLLFRAIFRCLWSATSSKMKFTPISTLSRRQFRGGSLAAATAVSLPIKAMQDAASKPIFDRKIKLGIVGNGGRGGWIANLFKKHGGYEMRSVADYFQHVADSCGDAVGVDSTRRFATLSGYKRLLESGIEALAIETPPYFMPEIAREAVERGIHVYLAKPVAVDVPGALSIRESGAMATQRDQVFLVDYQMPTDPVLQEIVRRIHDGALGEIAQVSTVGITHAMPELPAGAHPEQRLRDLSWVNDVAYGCDYIGNFDIHAIDAAMWALNDVPVAAMGESRIRRPAPHGDSRDVCSVIYEYANGVVHNHFGQGLANNSHVTLDATIHGTEAMALLHYWGDKAYIRGGPMQYGGKVENLYEAGAVRNIDRFYHDVTTGRFDNDTVQRSVDGVLACVLGYEAAARGERLTMADVIRENRRLEIDLSGLKS